MDLKGGMDLNQLAISPGHYKIGTGARDLIDEVTEARKVVDHVAYLLSLKNIGVSKIVDNRSSSQIQNLNYLVSEHNKKIRILDISIHFNSSGIRTNQAIGTEVLYFRESIKSFAQKVSQSISDVSGLKNRGAKKRELVFLTQTNQPAILIEVCFVNSVKDVDIYQKKFHDICQTIADCVMEFILSKDTKKIAPNPSNTYLIDELWKLSFTSPTLKERLVSLFQDEHQIETILKKGIAADIIQESWMEKLQSRTISSADILGLSTLILQEL